ncbi:hypothetical protein [Thermoanaerobacterium sp. RBIITD]|uniref:hypothetical protein n=1 Tax=Thermoanaerobacterium sp. RBIITD TaxID=1550240 RepID=UPI000BB97CC8|nr:hypothetical protein [Thermoanaerobacterium sp. RBIITD]SNX54179.1 hypothetical protein SAMN05660242_1814 [Thermoanaerobacterium sp. RBIITD]
MSYDIIYDRRFIKVDDLYVPMIEIGSNNTFEISASGREIPEKYWMELVCDKNKYLYSKEEILQTAKELDECGGIYKSRYRSFEKDEFVKYIMSGIKNAKSLEIYIKWGNNLILRTSDNIKYPQTTKELKNELIFAALASTKINLYFSERDFKIGNVLTTRNLSEYPYVIKDDYYLTRIYGRNTWWDDDINNALKFKTKKEAEKFLKKHKKDPVQYVIIHYFDEQQNKQGNSRYYQFSLF